MLYIHIPFCGQRCIYCDFYSTTQSRSLTRPYIKAVAHEIKCRASELPSSTLTSVYVGGGTPSLLTGEAIKELFSAVHNNFQIAPEAEITFEANPDDITPELIKNLISQGVNRISLGIQSFNDGQLKLLHRRHTSHQAQQAVKLIHESGIPHISIDLIYGQPRQTLNLWRSDLVQALSLPIDHLSAYALSVEDNTPLSRLINTRKLTLPTDEETSEMFRALCEATRQAGFQHYEISNFCKPDGRARHNSGYWKGTPYLGVGPGAHSYDGATRYSNPSQLSEYIAQNGIMERTTEHLTPDEQCNDYVFTSLRTSDGLHLPTLAARHGSERANNILKWAAPHISSKRLAYTNDTLCLTQQGIFVSNDVISDLMHIS